jgi:hypothetical protein
LTQAGPAGKIGAKGKLVAVILARGGQRADLGLLPFIQRAVDGQELVVLVFTHIRLLSGAQRR